MARKLPHKKPVIPAKAGILDPHFRGDDTIILGKGFISDYLKASLNAPVASERINTLSDVEKIIKKYQPKVLINCIGHTGKSNVDDCELVPDKTIQSNTFVPILLGEAALRYGFKLIHISSGCIYHFDLKKSKPLTEEQTPNYYTLYYSRTKIYAEHVLNELSKRANILVTRIRIPLIDHPHPKNILNKLIQYKKVLDIPNSVTYVPDFAKMLKHLIKIDAKGIYNCVNKGALRYPQLMKVYKNHVPSFEYTVLPLKKLGLNRTNLTLSTQKLEATGFKVRKIQDVLDECVRRYLQ